MSSIVRRKFFFDEVEVNGAKELDYLSGKLYKANLVTVDNYTITQVTEYRPDLISLIKYGNYNLGWLIAYHNDMIDPVLEFTMGKVIKIPSLDDYYKFYNQYARKV